MQGKNHSQRPPMNDVEKYKNVLLGEMPEWTEADWMAQMHRAHRLSESAADLHFIELAEYYAEVLAFLSLWYGIRTQCWN